MTETKTCTAEQLLAGFAQLSPEDQEKVRAKLGEGATADPTGPCCDPTAMMEQMMGKMKTGGCDPMAMCKELMEKKQAGDLCLANRHSRRYGKLVEPVTVTPPGGHGLGHHGEHPE